MTARRPAAPRSGPARPSARPGAAPSRTPAQGVGRPAAAPSRPAAAARPSSPSRPGRTARTATAPPAGPGRAPRATRPARPPRHAPVLRPTTMLAAVLVILALLIVPYLRPWIAQRQQLAAQQQQVADLRRSVTELTAERERWKDPAYVKAQAGERLNFVMPGQTRYTLLDDTGATADTHDPRTSARAAAAAAGDRPWYGTIWESARAAGRQDG